MLQNILAKTNTRCFHSIDDNSMGYEVKFFLGQSDSCVETSASLLWLELEHTYKTQPSLPSWIPLQHLQLLKISGGSFKTLWANHTEIFPYQHQLSKSCRDFQRVSGSDDPIKLRELIISWCTELEDLPSLSRLSCMEKIQIHSCYKLQNITLPTSLISLSVQGCRDLQRVLLGYGDFIELTELIISDCPVLEEVPSLSRLSWMENIEIASCEKLEKISGIEELYALEYMQLGSCSNAIILNCILNLKSAPRNLYMIGKAVDGVESSLNEYLFSEANVGANEVTEIVTHNSGENSGAMVIKNWWKKREVTRAAVIGCFLVVVDSSSSAKDINDCLQLYNEKCRYESSTWPKVHEGEEIITIIASGFLSDDANDISSFYADFDNAVYVLSRNGLMKKGFRIEVKKGEEWKCSSVLHTIVDRLHHKGLQGDVRKAEE